MRMDTPPDAPRRVNLLDVFEFLDEALIGVVFFIVCIFFCLALSTPARAASSLPAQRLARQLPPSAVEAHARRARHNAALKELFSACGLPEGSTAEAIEARAAAMSQLSGEIKTRAAGETAAAAGAAAAAAAAAGFLAGRKSTKALTH